MAGGGSSLQLTVNSEQLTVNGLRSRCCTLICCWGTVCCVRLRVSEPFFVIPVGTRHAASATKLNALNALSETKTNHSP